MRAWFFAVVLLVACGSPVVDVNHAQRSRVTKADASAVPGETASRVARVERGLIPEVRVNGEHGGASIEDRLRAHHTPGVSIAIIHDYRVVAAKAYGVADATTGARLTETTLMQAASVSKMFTATAALKEVEAGKIPLDADVNRTLRSWHLPENEKTHATPITLKHLLSHTGGINVPSVIQEGRSPTLLELLDGKPPAVTRPVRVEGAIGKFEYSGGGLAIVQQMLVDVEKHPFPEVMTDLVFAPFGLSHSTFSQPSTTGGLPVASGHDFDATRVGGDVQAVPGAAAAGLWSTPSDIARLLVEVQLGLRGRSAVVSKEIATRMTTPVIATGGDAIAAALGTFVEKHDAGVYFGHDGLGIGFVTVARASMKDGEGAVVMANGQNAIPLLMEILRSIAAEYRWEGWLAPPIDVASVDAAHLATFAGRYGNAKESVRIAVKGNRLEPRQAFEDDVELLPISSDVFVSRADGSRYTFAGGVSLSRSPSPWPPGGASVTLPRVADEAPAEPLDLLESGKFEESLAAIRKRFATNPKEPLASESRLRAIGEDILDRKQDPARALPVFQINLALHPASAMAAVNVAEALVRSGRANEALPVYEQSKKLFERNEAMGELERVFCRWRLARVRALLHRS